MFMAVTSLTSLEASGLQTARLKSRMMWSRCSGSLNLLMSDGYPSRYLKVDQVFYESL